MAMMPNPRCVIFCSNPLDSAQVEPDFAREFAAANAACLATLLIDYDAVRRGDDGVKSSPPQVTPVGAIYRGWMFTVDRYEHLYASLARRGYALATSPLEYRTCHHLPGWYDRLRDVSPRSVWI